MLHDRCPWPDHVVSRALQSSNPTIKLARLVLARNLGINLPDGRRLQRRVRRRIEKADRLSPDHRKMVEHLFVLSRIAHSGS